MRTVLTNLFSISKIVAFLITYGISVQTLLYAQLPDPCPSDTTQASDLCNEICIYGNFNGYTGTTIGYSGQTPPGFCGTIENEQWFGFIAYDTVATFTLNALNCIDGNGLQLAIYTSCGGMPVVCYPGNMAGETVPINLTVPLTPGVNYFLMIDGYAGDQCSFQLTVTPASAVSPPLVGPTGLLSGPAGVCPNGSFTFSIPPVSGAGYYLWDAPAGWLIDGQIPPVYRIAPAGHSVQVTPNTAAGDICVQPLNSFYQGTQVCQSVDVFPPINANTLISSGLTGSCLLTGGLPQSNGSAYDAVVMSLQGNPAVTATLTTPPFTHEDTVNFTVPQAGTYQLVATDLNGCSGATTVIAGNGAGGGGSGQQAGGCWQWQNPLPQGNALYTVHFTDEQTGWAVGYKGTILKTIDGGQTWAAQASGTGSHLIGVVFADSQTGWAAGYDGVILKTVDGGETWIRQPSGTTKYLNYIWFVDLQTGWAVGADGTILKTTDGGATWNPQASGTAKYLNCVYFLDSQNGWAVGAGFTTLRTTDGGQTWSQHTSGFQTLYHVYFTDAQTGWAVGGNGIIIKTTDGGLTWNAQPKMTNNPLYCIHFTDSQTGWASGVGGTILRTLNGGQTWLAQSSGTGNFLSGIYSLDGQTAWAVGDNGAMLKTTNSGASWYSQSGGIANLLESVRFVDGQTGWAVGANGVILKTGNSGQSWYTQNSGTAASLRAVFFTDSQTGWAAGENGAILKTANGGLNWNLQNTPTTQTLSDIFFADGQTGWAAGVNGVILKTLDGGLTWNTQNTGTNTELTTVIFSGTQTGWAAGANGMILKTTDGGLSWTPQISGTPAFLNDLFFADLQTGWAAGDNGVILKTTDGGATWVAQTSGTAARLSAIHFTDNQTGWATGVSGVLIKTTDGGQTWMDENAGTTNTLWDVWFSDSQTGWVVGQNGVILKYAAAAPVCIATIPLHQQTDVVTTAAIAWPPAGICIDGYRLSLGATPGGSDILNHQDVGNTTIYQPAQPLPAGDTVFVRVAPYNGVGEASGCAEFWFVTESNCLTVTNTADSGPGSLREAINCANANPGPDTIRFNIDQSLYGPAPYIINLLTSLAPITGDSTVVDATSQPGWKMGNIQITGDVSPMMTIQANGFSLFGIHFHGPNSNTLLYLNDVPNRWANLTIGDIGKGNVFSGALTGFKNSNSIFNVGSGLSLVGNYFGTDPTGSTLSGQSPEFCGVTIQYYSANLKNNLFTRVTCITSALTQSFFVENNKFGTNINEDAVFDFGGSSLPLLSCGGHVFIKSNVFSTANIAISLGSTSSMDISENKIGLKSDGVTPFQPTTNFDAVILMCSGFAGKTYNVMNNTITGFRNGITACAVPIAYRYNISRNSIYCNSNAGIFISNNTVRATITAATPIKISGSSVNASGNLLTVEVFRNNDSNCIGYPCQGKVFLGSAVLDASGNWFLDCPGGVSPSGVALNVNDKITATLLPKLAGGATSNFSMCASISCPNEVPACLNPSSSLMDGLVANYTFDSHACDVSGNNNNATPNGGFAYTSDRFGNPGGAGNFNATNSYVAAPSSNSLNSPTTSITLAGWAKANLPVPELHGFLTKISDQTIQYRMGVAPASDPAKTNIYLSTSFSNILVPLTGDYDALQWNHYAVSWNGTEVRFFLNGIQVDTEKPFSGTIASNTGTNLEIGRDIHGGDEWTDGVLDDLRVYNRDLTPNEVKLLAGIYAETSDTLVCSGDTVTLSSTIPNASSYAWRHLQSNTIAGTGATVTATVTADAAFELTVMVDTCAYVDTLFVMVDSLAATFTGLGPDIVLCESQPVLLVIAAPPGCAGCSIVWSDGSTDTLLTVTPDSTTVYSVTLTNINGCAATDSVLVTIDNLGIDCGLVAHYRFDGDAQDASGKNNHGTPAGSFTWSRDRFGNCESALHLNGYFQKGWVKVPNSPSLQFNAAKQMTAALWVELDTLAGMSGTGAYSPNGLHILMAKAGDGIATPDGFYHHINGSGSDLRYSAGSSSGNMNIGALVHPGYSKTWKHLTLVMTPDSIKLYVDGVLTAQNVSNTDFSAADAEDLYLGIMGGFGAGKPSWYPLLGSLDDVRLYNRALSAAEITQLVNLPNPGPAVSIVPDTPAVCSGTPLTLTASGGVTYQWSDGGPATAQWTVTPTMTKTYTVTITDANNCARVDSVLVTIDPACDLIAHYPLDGDAQDASGNGLHGQNFGAIPARDRFGNCGRAMYFNSSSINVPHDDRLNFTNDFSFAFWFQKEGATFGHVIGKGRDNQNAYYFTANNGPSQNIDAFSVYNAPQNMVLSSASTAAQEWHHVVCIYDKTDMMLYLYVDGVLAASETATNDFVFNNVHPLVLGRHCTIANGCGAFPYFFKGWIDDVRLYARALTPNDIAYLYNLPNDNPNLAPAAALTTSKPALCSGESVLLNASPVQTGYTYTWYRDGNLLSGATDTTYLATQPGNYQVRVSAAGCDSLSAPVTLTAAPAVAAAILAPNGNTLTCTQISLALQASGGDTFAWSNNLGSSATATVTAPGTYTVTVTDSATGCSATATASVSQIADLPNVSAAGGTLTCGNPVILLQGNSSTPGAIFTWTGPNGFIFNGQNPPVNTAGTYTLTVTDPANGCTAVAMAIVSGDNALPSAAITTPSGAQITCTTNSVALQVPAVGGYTYAWSGGLGNNAAATTAVPGTYTVTVTNTANNCSTTGSVVVTQNTAAPNAAAAGGALTCAQPFVILQGSSSTPDATFFWNGPNGFAAGQPNPPVNVAGTYTLTVTNPQNGCTATATASVIQNNALPALSLATPNGTAVTCVQPLVSLQASAPGPMAYTWSGPNGFTFNGPNPAVNTAGTYTVTVTNTTSSCSNTASATVTVNNTPPTAALNLPNGAQLSCAQPAVVLEVIGGDNQSWAGPNGFTFSGPAPTVTVPGIYTVTVANAANGCSSAITVTVTQNKTTPTATAAAGAITCLQPSVTLQGISSTPGVSWLWSGPGGFTSNLQNPTASAGGTYLLTVTNPQNGCTATATTVIQQNQTPPVVSLSLPNGAQLTCAQPALTLQASAPGTMAYTWSGPAGFIFNGANPAVNAAGTYTVTVTNQATGCTATATAAISENKTPPTAGIAAPGGQSITCVQPLVTLQGSGGGTYTWAGPNGYQFNGPNATVNVAGTYTLTVTNPANGCTGSATAGVSENKTPPIAAISPTGAQITCAQPSAVLQGSGGGSYSWAGPNGFTFIGQTPAVTAAGVYTLTVSNPLNGCTASATATVSADQAPPGINAAGGQLSCQTMAVILLGGSNTPGAGLSWTGPGGFVFNGPNPAVNLPGAYTLTVTHPLNGCTATQEVTVTPPPTLTPAVSGPAKLCPGGSLTLTAGSGYAAYLWSNGADTPAITVSQVGTYTVTVTDAGQCTGAKTVVITLAEPPAPVIAGPSTLCSGSSITLDAGGGYAQYDWSNGQKTQTIAVDMAGTYSVTVTDVNGCSGTATTVVGLVAAPNPGAGSNSPLCAGEQLKLFTGSGAGWKYAWSGPAGFASTVQNPVRNATTSAMSGQYLVAVTDGNNCTGTATVVVLVASDYLTETDTVVCSGNTLLNGKPVTADTTIQQVYTTAAGCDSLVILTVTVVGENTIQAVEDKTFLLPGETTLTINVTANDTLRTDWTLDISQQPGKGTAQALNRDELRYTRIQNDQFGYDVFQYILCAADNCTDLCDTASVYIYLQGSTLEQAKTTIPNGFVPESTIDSNRVFDPLGALNAFGILIPLENAKFYVYNRWGETVFQANPYAPWEGRQNDRPLPQGTYYYRLVFIRDDKDEWIEGPVHLLR